MAETKQEHIDSRIRGTMASNFSFLMSSWGRNVAKKLMKAPTKFKPTYESKWNIVRGDVVKVIKGPQKGQQGKVLEVIRPKNRIIIDGVNMRRRNFKANDGTPGKIVVIPCSIHYSNAMLIDPTNGLPTRVARRFLEDGTKVRVSKRSGHIIPKPDPLANKPPRSMVVGPKDTMPAEVFNVTFADYEKYLPYIYSSDVEESKQS